LNRLRACFLIVATAGGLSATARYAWRERDSVPPLSNVLARARELVEPGPLSIAHRGIAALEDCAACHSTTTAVADEKCLSCHTSIAERIADHGPMHGGRLQGNCAECHADHRESLIDFDREAFQHDFARFRLRGAHQDLACESCHTLPRTREEWGPVGFHYLELASSSCANCHASPHVESTFADDLDCARCHDAGATSWSIDTRTFDHARTTSFPLDDRHRTLDCTACHANRSFAPVPRDCAGCHVEAVAALEGRVRIGSETLFLAASPHARIVRCESCHDGATDSRTIDSAAKCASCHTDRYADLFHDQNRLFTRLELPLRALLDQKDTESKEALREGLDAALRLQSHAPTAARAILSDLSKRYIER